MRNERYYTYLILFLALVMNWVVDGTNALGKTDLNLGLLPKKSLIIIEVFQAVFLGYLLIKYQKYKRLYIWGILIAGFLSFQLLLHVLLKHDPTIWISGIRYYFSFVPLFFLGYIYGVKNYKFEKEFKLLLFLIFIQVPVSIWQFFIAQARILGTGELYFDAIAGTMGGFAPNLMSMLVSIGIIYYLIKYIDKRQLKYAIFALILMIPPIISESKGMYLVIIVISFYLVQVSKLNLKRIFGIFIIVITLVFGFIVAYQSLDFGLSQAKSFQFSYILEYIQSKSGSGRLSRIDSIIYATNLVLEEQSPIFGMGIGSANANPIGSNPPYNNFFTIRHSIDTMITETGYLGIFLLVSFFAYSFFLSWKLLKQKKITDQFQLYMIKLSGGIILILSVGAFWEDILFRVQFMYPFGLIIGYIFGLNKLVNNRN